MANSNKSSDSKNPGSAPLIWMTKHLYKPGKPKKENGKKHPDLQIDGTLSIRQMVQRYNQGMSVPVSNYEYLDGETLHPSADLTEKHDYIKKYSKIANSEVLERERGTGGETSPPPITNPEDVQDTTTNES